MQHQPFHVEAREMLRGRHALGYRTREECRALTLGWGYPITYGLIIPYSSNWV